MPRLTKIYTRKGDDGSTALGSGRRVQKDDLQVAAYGDVDELNAVLGAALATGVAEPLRPTLLRIQSELLNLGGELCLLGAVASADDDGQLDTEQQREIPQLIREEHVEKLEQECDRFNATLGPLANFILPGGTEGSAMLHVARTVCRRAERSVVTLANHLEVREASLSYINRLSDFLFIAARFENHSRGVDDVLWDRNV